MSLYTDLINAGVPVSNWQSDLYFEDNEISRAIVKKHPGIKCRAFKNQRTGTMIHFGSRAKPNYIHLGANKMAFFIVREYTIELQKYHDDIIGRLIFKNEKGEIEESGLYSLLELTNMVYMWIHHIEDMRGSFCIGTKLAPDAQLTITTKG
jgi:hypothetical protein